MMQDLQGGVLDPLTTATVSYGDDSNRWAFEIGFVPAGDYTLAFTCDATLDSPDSDDSGLVAFSDSVNVSVVAGEDSTVSIPN